MEQSLIKYNRNRYIIFLNHCDCRKYMDVNYPTDICILCSVKAVKPFKVFKSSRVIAVKYEITSHNNQ